jgi:hypothetical protein
LSGKRVYVAKSSVQYGTNYVVLFSGGVNAANNHMRYYDNIKAMYQTIVSSCNVRPENVYIIYADGTDPGVDRDDGQSSDMSYAVGAHVLSATKTNLLNTLSLLAGKVDSTDQFLFYSFDHGGGAVNQPMTTGEEVLNGWGSDTRDYELAPALQAIHGLHSTYVFAECFAGGMLDNLLSLPAGVYGCAATNHYEYSWGDGFAKAFQQALANGWRYTGNVFNQAKANDPYAITSAYPDNGGTWTDGKEHPWGTGGFFPIFLNYFSNVGAWPIPHYIPITILHRLGTLVLRNGASGETHAIPDASASLLLDAGQARAATPSDASPKGGEAAAKPLVDLALSIPAGTDAAVPLMLYGKLGHAFAADRDLLDEVFDLTGMSV